MRTTLDIEDDVLQAAKELAKREGSSAGKVISSLARAGLTAQGRRNAKMQIKNGVPILSSRGETITLEKIRRIMDAEGI